MGLNIGEDMTADKTIIIPQSDVKRVLDMKTAISVVEQAFRSYGENHVQMPEKIYLKFAKGDLRCMPSYINGQDYAGVKNVNVHPGNTNLSSVMALAMLIRSEDGFPVAIMDATYITAMRTGASGGIAAKYLSRQDSQTAGFIGTGAQARSQLEALLLVRPGIEKIFAYDIDEHKKNAFCAYAGECALKYEHVLDIEASGSIEHVVRNSDILTTLTPVRVPFVKQEWVREGTHINAIGADAKGKHELCDSLVRNSRVVVDSWPQASQSGEINVLVTEKLISRNDICADIGEIVTGKKPGRADDGEITIFDSTGLAIQDLACMIHVFSAYKKNPALFEKSHGFQFFE